MNNRSIVTVKFVESKKFPDFHINQFNDLRIFNHVNLVQENQNLGNVHLTCKQNVLTGLRHRTISSSNNQNSTVHLGSTCNHVLNIVSVTRTVNVCIMPVCCLILNVSCINGNTPFFFFRCIIN